MPAGISFTEPMSRREFFGKNVAGQRHRFLQAEFDLRRADIVKPAIAARFKPRAEIPVIQIGLRFALQCLLEHQRRRAVLQRDVALEI